MMDLVFRDLSAVQTQQIAAAAEAILSGTPAIREVKPAESPEGIVRWLLEDPTEHQVSMLKAIANAAPKWITAAELGERTGLSSAQMGGVNARLHSRVSFHYGPEAFPWERQDAGDIVRYRMTPSVAAAVLDSLAVADPNAKE